MKTSWKTERKWERSKDENKFEELLKENGFGIIGFREYMSKTDYLLSKDGIEIESSLPHDKSVNVKGCVDFLIKSFNVKRELIELLNAKNNEEN